ncbi:MAG TPA: carboxypeptidase-like regulatory domain-containing protein [Bacteroidia bacterium]|jgi:outer membrane receptor for ferrienterochelin and colicins|nr:carboxypeptidase-like regulatory domain-containing protein [Bacteroidia bacterium]
MKKVKYIFFFCFICVFSKNIFSQNTLTGKVFEITEKGDTSVLTGATLFWLHATIGTNSDENGKYTLQKTTISNKLIISFVGFENDTATIDTTQTHADFLLSNAKTLKEVVVVYQGKGSEFSFMNPIKTETLGQRELAKAACCNLSESFETNPSVDVNFADAVTGTKQIQMLGLSGQYALITKENMPYLRGLASIYGLSFIPGTWIQSIQLSKGAGSVINGYESFTGQINTELQKPDNSEKLFFNTYVNANGRNEYNLNAARKLTDVWSTVLLLHTSFNPLKQDFNNDGFLDIPTGKQYNVANKWQYNTRKGFEGQFGGSYILDNRTGGQMAFNEKTNRNSDSVYGLGISTERYEASAKNGFVFRNKLETSTGLQLSFIQHKQDNYYGINNYKGLQQTFYANYIFQGILGNTNHKYKTGASYLWDNVSETYKLYNFSRIESVPGVFGEYAYSYLTSFNAVAGLRADYHNYYGLFFTPRLHLRYAFKDNNTIIRASAGRALKTANVFAENSALMASSRDFIIIPSNFNMPYGLDPEIAWNYGLNFLHKFKLNYREAQIALDAYRTDFTNQVVIDMDANPQQVLIYNLKGQSFSNTLQTEFSWEVRKRLNVRLAYRYIDTRTQYTTGLLSKYLVSKNRAFINLSYETKNQHWQFDYTTQWHGAKRLPNTNSNPIEYRRADYSPAYFIMNGQITYKTGILKSFDIYIGVENALNTRQLNPIVSANNPFSSYFDASMVWGPIYGRMLYGGIRFKIK